MSNFDGRLDQPKKKETYLRISFFDGFLILKQIIYFVDFFKKNFKRTYL
jgi:hypothetical protein